MRPSSHAATPCARCPLQATALELFDAWDEHCGRPRRPAFPSPASGGEVAKEGDQPPAPAPRPSRMDELQEVEGGEAAEVQDDGSALLGDEVERRSWQRRFRYLGVGRQVSVLSRQGRCAWVVSKAAEQSTHGLSPAGRRPSSAALPWRRGPPTPGGLRSGCCLVWMPLCPGGCSHGTSTAHRLQDGLTPGRE